MGFSLDVLSTPILSLFAMFSNTIAYRSYKMVLIKKRMKSVVRSNTSRPVHRCTFFVVRILKMISDTLK